MFPPSLLHLKETFDKTIEIFVPYAVFVNTYLAQFLGLSSDLKIWYSS